MQDSYLSKYLSFLELKAIPNPEDANSFHSLICQHSLIKTQIVMNAGKYLFLILLKTLNSNKNGKK